MSPFHRLSEPTLFHLTVTLRGFLPPKKRTVLVTKMIQLSRLTNALVGGATTEFSQALLSHGDLCLAPTILLVLYKF